MSVHYPILYVLIPLFGAVLSAISGKESIARRVSLFSLFLAFLLSIYALYLPSPYSYDIGGYGFYGIEYRIDHAGKIFLCYINALAFFIFLFCGELMEKTVLAYISGKRAFTFYPIFLFAHAGYSGILCTNDFFNLYVFIEISSLSTYVLISLGKSKKAPAAAFDYLVLGTIGATSILIGIGLFLAKTGFLNLPAVLSSLQNIGYSKAVALGVAFFVIGALLKVAFFPMHFWAAGAYEAAPAVIVSYLSGISGIVGIYIIIRFLGLWENYSYTKNLFTQAYAVIGPAALVAIIWASFTALRQKEAKRILIYSIFSQIGYIIYILPLKDSAYVVTKFLLADSLNKASLFLLISYAPEKFPLNFKGKSLAAALILFSAGAPFTTMFFVKIDLARLLLLNEEFTAFAVTVAGSALSFLYNYEIARRVIFDTETSPPKETPHPLTLAVAAQIIFFFLSFRGVWV